MAVEGAVDPGSTNTRFQLVSGPPPMLPGKCHGCGSFSGDRSYVDISLHVNKFGRVYICDLCWTGTAHDLFNMSMKSYVDILVDTRDKALDDKTELYTQIAELENALAAIDQLRSVLGISDTAVSRDEMVSEPSTPEPERASSKPAKTERVATKQDAKPGSANVFDVESTNDFLSQL